MKKLFALCVLSMAALAQNASAFQVAATAYVYPNFVTATACNTDYATVIACNVTTTGLLNTGIPIYSTATLYLAPGQCDNAYVYATYPYLFINGTANAWCSF